VDSVAMRQGSIQCELSSRSSHRAIFTPTLLKHSACFSAPSFIGKE
jgi:hypothetical protein